MTNPETVRLVQTCGACPEQYDVFLGDQMIGYLRLRHGEFRADYLTPLPPNENTDHWPWRHETVYRANPEGDGCFAVEERDYYLRFAVDAILKRHEAGPPEEHPPAPDVKYVIE